MAQDIHTEPICQRDLNRERYWVCWFSAPTRLT